MSSLQSQLCVFKGCIPSVLKSNKKRQEGWGFRGLKVFLTMLVLALHNPQTWRDCSSTKHDAVPAFNHQRATESREMRESGEGGREEGGVCVFVFRGMTDELLKEDGRGGQKCLCTCDSRGIIVTKNRRS